MRIKLRELRKIISKSIVEYSPSFRPSQTAQSNSEYDIKELAKRIYAVAKNFKAHQGMPSDELMAQTLETGAEAQKILETIKNKPEYVYLNSLVSAFKPLVNASGKLSKPAFLGKGSYASANLEAADQVIKQLQRFKKEVLNKQTSSLVGYEKE